MAGAVHIICGPTAGGKSEAALEAAETDGGTIINADSQQAYAELPVLSACPTAEDTRRAPHKLYGFLKGDERIDAHRWSRLAAEEIRAAWAAGRTPHVVGGTGFYIKALVEGLPEMPAIPQDVRANARREGAAKTGAELHSILAARDPELAAILKPGDKARILRGLEVYQATGKPLSAWRRREKRPPLPGAKFEFQFVDHPMDELEARIAARVEKMFAAGAAEEVRALMQKGYGEEAPIWRVIGARQILGMISGRANIEETKAAIVLATRQYAKRQRTFFRTQFK